MVVRLVRLLPHETVVTAPDPPVATAAYHRIRLQLYLLLYSTRNLPPMEMQCTARKLLIALSLS